MSCIDQLVNFAGDVAGTASEESDSHVYDVNALLDEPIDAVREAYLRIKICQKETGVGGDFVNDFGDCRSMRFAFT